MRFALVYNGTSKELLIEIYLHNISFHFLEKKVLYEYFILNTDEKNDEQYSKKMSCSLKKICIYLMNPQSNGNNLLGYELFIEEDFSNLERNIEKIMEEEAQPFPFLCEDILYNNENI